MIDPPTALAITDKAINLLGRVPVHTLHDAVGAFNTVFDAIAAKVDPAAVPESAPLRLTLSGTIAALRHDHHMKNFEIGEAVGAPIHKNTKGHRMCPNVTRWAHGMQPRKATRDAFRALAARHGIEITDI